MREAKTLAKNKIQLLRHNNRSKAGQCRYRAQIPRAFDRIARSDIDVGYRQRARRWPRSETHIIAQRQCPTLSEKAAVVIRLQIGQRRLAKPSFAPYIAQVPRLT